MEEIENRKETVIEERISKEDDVNKEDDINKEENVTIEDKIMEEVLEREAVSECEKTGKQTAVCKNEGEQVDAEGKSDINLMETLYDISKSVDLALALLNGDKNKCKNELKKIKRTLKKYIEEIK